MFYAENLSRISSDPWILETVKTGVKLEFLSLLSHSREFANMHINESQKEICDREIKDLLFNGAIIRVNVKRVRQPDVCYPKERRGFFLIIN